MNEILTAFGSVIFVLGVILVVLAILMPFFVLSISQTTKRIHRTLMAVEKLLIQHIDPEKAASAQTVKCLECGCTLQTSMSSCPNCGLPRVPDKI